MNIYKFFSIALFIHSNFVLPTAVHASNAVKANVSILVAALKTLNEQEQSESASSCSRCKGYCILAQHMFQTHFNDTISEFACSECTDSNHQSFCVHSEYSSYLFQNFCKNKSKCHISDCAFVCVNHLSDNKLIALEHGYKNSIKIKLFCCRNPECKKVFTSNTDRQEHYYGHFKEIDPKIIKKTPRQKMVDFECSLCPFKTKNQTCLEHHEKHHPEYKCHHEGCDFTTFNHYEMTWHLNARGSFVCSYLIDGKTPCNLAFYTEKLLLAHQNEDTHHEINPDATTKNLTNSKNAPLLL